MASPLPTLQYLVAFQNNAFDDPALITTVASPAGTLGANNVWTDITSFVMSHTFDRGRQHELSQFEAGKCDLVLNNRDGRFSPFNTSSPYNGFLTVRKLFQIRQTWSGVTYTRFTGMVDAWPTDWPDQTSQWCSLHVSDAFRALNLADITTGGYPAQVITDGAGGYWRLGDPVGAITAADSSGNNHPGSPNGTVVFGQTGPFVANTGTGCSLGTSSGGQGWFNISSAAAPTGQTYTLEAWVNVTTWSAGSTDNMILQWFDATITNSAVWWVNGSNQMVFQATDGTNLLSLNTLSAMPTGGWHHFVVTRSTTTVVMYLDGVSQTLHTVSALNAGAFTPTALYMGSDFVAGNPVGEFPGSLQEVAIYPSTALTGTQVLNHYNLAVWPQESTDTRIGRVLNAINWSAGARALDAGKSTVQKQTASLTSTSSLSHMQQCEGTEGGALFMTGDGKVKFLARTTLQSNSLYTTSQQKIGDNTAGGDMPFQPSPQLALDDIDLFNEASATRTGGNTQVYSNSTSITSFGRNTWTPPTTLVGISDAEVLALTQYIVAKFATPVVRVQSVTVDLLELITPNIVANLLSLDLLYQVTVERTVTPDGGTAFTQTANIERIHEVVAPDSWQVTFQLAKADPGWWILGTSQLGTQTALGW